MIKHIERYFWIFLLVALVGGFAIPSLLNQFQGYVIYLLMTIMGILFLKVDILDIVTHIKNPLYLFYIAFINLIITPLLTYLLISPFHQNLTIGLVLLAALPAGVSSAVFTDIMNGRTSLSLTLVILTNLLAIFTIPFIFWVLFHQNIDINPLALLQDLLMVILIPFIIAKILKRIILKNIIHHFQDYYNILIVILVTSMVMITIAFQAPYIIANISSLLPTLGVLYLAFFGFQLIGYFSTFWCSKGRKLAVSNSNMIMNNILGIVLAIAFFPPNVTTLIILSFIPWVTMISIKHWYRRFLP